MKEQTGHSWISTSYCQIQRPVQEVTFTAKYNDMTQIWSP